MSRRKEARRKALARAKSKRWYRKNAARLQQQRSSYIPIGQFKHFRRNPNREQQVGITNFVVCRVCGAKLLTLIGGPASHLSTHGLTRAQYRRKWPGAPLICESLRRDLSVRAGRPAKWPIVWGIVQGKTYKQIGSELKSQRFFTTEWAAARKMGFGGKAKARIRPAFYDFGEPVTAEAVRTLRNITGLSVPQFAQRTSLNASVITDAIRRRQRGIQPGTAKKIIVWRDDLIRHLLKTAADPAHGQDRYGGSRILKTFFPDLRLKRALLLQVMRWCRSSASVTTTTDANDLGEQFCAQAMVEVRQGSHERLFVRFLPWAPDLLRFFQTNLEQLKGHGNLWPLADEAIAQRWGATPHVLSSAWRLRSLAIPPDEMRRLINEAQAPKSAAEELVGKKEKKKPGRHPRDIFAQADQLKREGRTWSEIAQDLDPQTFAHSPKAAAEAIRQGVRRFRRRKAPRTKYAS